MLTKINLSANKWQKRKKPRKPKKQRRQKREAKREDNSCLYLKLKHQLKT
jgi:hypothetical protein